MTIKKFFMPLLFVLSLFLQSPAFSEPSKGVIVFCDDNLVIIQSLSTYDYTMGELYSFGIYDIEDKVVGEMNSYGIHDFYNLNKDVTMKIYVDDYNGPAKPHKNKSQLL